MKVLSRVGFAFWLVLLAAAAQNVTSSLRGVAVDPSAAGIPDVDCRLTNSATGASLSTRSAMDGSFVLNNIPPGRYTLSLEAKGFRNLRVADIVVSSSEVRALGNLTMQIGEIVESVDVTAQAAAVQLASSEKSGLLTASQINSIAVKGRDFMTLLVTIPGVVDTRVGGREAPSNDASYNIHINGARQNQKGIMVDGIVNIDIGNNEGLQVSPNMDAIAEMRVLTSNYQAEYGRNAGGQISVVTKSGTRQFHGTAYTFVRNEILNANNFFNNRTGTKKPPYRYNISGFSLGGPVFLPGKFNANRDKLFFFFSQEYIGRKVDYGARFVNMPTAPEREGDFSRSYDLNGALIPVRDPLNQQPFAGNLVPRTRINTLGQKILSFFPLPNYTDPDPRLAFSRNYRDVYSGNYPKRDDVIRIDGNWWRTVQLYYRYINDTDERLVPWGVWLTGNRNFLITPTRWGNPGKTHSGGLTKTFSPTLVNEFRFGSIHSRYYYELADNNAVARSKVGNPPRWFQASPKVADIMPDLLFGGQPANPPLTGLANVPFFNYIDNYVASNNLSKVWGSHNLKAGVYLEKAHQYMATTAGDTGYRGRFDFSRNVNNPFDSNHSFANALLGYFNSYQESSARPDGDYHFLNLEWYVQDNWKVNRRLTLDIGLRFYHHTPVEERLRNTGGFDPDKYDPRKVPALFRPALNETGRRVAVDPRTGRLAAPELIGRYVPGSGDFANGLVVSGVGGFPSSFITLPAVVITPRFGFAYDLLGNGSTALRGGFGMYIDRGNSNPMYWLHGGPPINYTPVLNNGHLDEYARTAGYLGPSAVQSWLGKQKHAGVYSYSLGVQRRFLDTTLDVSYVGNVGRHLIMGRDINPVPMYGRFDPANGDPTRPGSPLPDNFFRRYVGYGGIISRNLGANSSYNSLQVAANRRFTRGLQFGLAYTVSKALGLTASDFGDLSPYFPARSRNYGLMPWDRGQVFVFNYSYDLPRMGSSLGWKPMKWILDNWQVSGITSFISGAPFTPGFGTVDGEDITGSSEGARITVTGNPTLAKSEKNFYRGFKTEVFRRTPSRSFGNAGVGILRGPGINNWDISISKRFPILSEERFLQFRTELFNAWNHTQFSAINSFAQFDRQGGQINPNFGVYSAARDPRVIQFSLKLFF